MKEVQECITRLENTIKAAQLNYEIWWVYKDKQTRDIYKKAINRYPLFFKTSIHAHFVSAIIALHRTLEEKETINFNVLVSKIKKGKLLDAAVLDEIEKDIEKAQPIWKKVCIIRNNVFGHASLKLKFEDVMKES